MKRLLSGILICALALTLGVSAFADAAVSLSDVQPGSWFYNEVSEMVAAGFIDGYEDGTFQPDRTVTVAEAVTMTARMTGAATGATRNTGRACRWRTPTAPAGSPRTTYPVPRPT